MSEVLLRVRGLKKSYVQGAGSLSILRGVDLDIAEGEALAIVGASGAGKSTLLQILGTLDRADEGEIRFEGEDLRAMNDEAVSKFRNQKMGFVFQFHHLLSEFTAHENVALPLRISGASANDAREQAAEWLGRMGLGARLDHYPNQLSGGELQRVAIARALIRQPKILFADEPTGNLDSQNGLKIQDLFFELKKTLNITFVVVTHDRAFAARFPRVLEMQDGLWKA